MEAEENVYDDDLNRPDFEALYLQSQLRIQQMRAEIAELRAENARLVDRLGRLETARNCATRDAK